VFEGLHDLAGFVKFVWAGRAAARHWPIQIIASVCSNGGTRAAGLPRSACMAAISTCLGGIKT
jgi:hypothetical protein